MFVNPCATGSSRRRSAQIAAHCRRRFSMHTIVGDRIESIRYKLNTICCNGPEPVGGPDAPPSCFISWERKIVLCFGGSWYASVKQDDCADSRRARGASAKMRPVLGVMISLPAPAAVI